MSRKDYAVVKSVASHPDNVNWDDWEQLISDPFGYSDRWPEGNYGDEDEDEDVGVEAGSYDLIRELISVLRDVLDSEDFDLYTRAYEICRGFIG